MWNEFLPISMPITAILLLSFSDMACSFVFSAPGPFGSLAGLEHGRTISGTFAVQEFACIGRIPFALLRLRYIVSG
jgi:hypothetical protein